MSRLPPSIAVVLARDVYALTDSPSVKLALAKIAGQYGGMFDVASPSVTVGKTGGPLFLKSRTAFGLCLIGKGVYAGHAFIILRGTRFLGDWLTNFNVGTSRSSFGQSSHDGFNKSFAAMSSQIEPFVSSMGAKGITHVHCIGHSLGGGLATLAAEYVLANTPFKPYLYTFGAPRVGLKSFADMLTSNLRPERMFRVYHRTDIVPCIPFWPFVHAPTFAGETYDYFQPSPGEFPSGEWHATTKYASTVGKQSWSALRNRRAVALTDNNVDAWLSVTSPMSFTTTNLEWVNRAISYVIKKCLGGVGALVTTAATSSFTLMDRISFILKQGIDLSKAVSGLVIKLIKKIMSILSMHRTLKEVDMTYAFIRQIFQSLSNRVSAHCQRAIDSVLVSGKSV